MLAGIHLLTCLNGYLLAECMGINVYVHMYGELR